MLRKNLLLKVFLFIVSVSVIWVNYAIVFIIVKKIDLLDANLSFKYFLPSLTDLLTIYIPIFAALFSISLFFVNRKLKATSLFFASLVVSTYILLVFFSNKSDFYVEIGDVDTTSTSFQNSISNDSNSFSNDSNFSISGSIDSIQQDSLYSSFTPPDSGVEQIIDSESGLVTIVNMISNGVNSVFTFIIKVELSFYSFFLILFSTIYLLRKK